MQIQYKCRCMKAERVVHVPDRVPGSDMDAWMGAVGACVSYDHRAHNLLCSSPKTDYLKIPLPEGSEEVGRPVTKQ